jgi:hypothetical protein
LLISAPEIRALHKLYHETLSRDCGAAKSPIIAAFSPGAAASAPFPELERSPSHRQNNSIESPTTGSFGA